MSLLTSLQQRAARNGLNLFGLVDAQRFDGCLPREQRATARRPGCGTIVALGTGGASFWQEFVRQGGKVPVACDGDAADAIAAAQLEVVGSVLEEAGMSVSVVDARRPSIDFARLAEAAGFGIVSPVSGMLLHPQYGPWLRIRGALLVDGHPFGPIADASITESFKPCCTCSRPCLTACPPAAHDDLGRSDRAKCADHRSAGGCASGCHSRLACPIGREHADGDGPMLHAHSVGRRTMQRWYGLGIWRFVPRGLRSAPRSR